MGGFGGLSTPIIFDNNGSEKSESTTLIDIIDLNSQHVVPDAYL